MGRLLAVFCLLAGLVASGLHGPANAGADWLARLDDAGPTRSCCTKEASTGNAAHMVCIGHAILAASAEPAPVASRPQRVTRVSDRRPRGHAPDGPLQPPDRSS